MLKNWREIKENIDEICGICINLWVIMLLFITCPIWGWFYILYLVLKRVYKSGR